MKKYMLMRAGAMFMVLMMALVPLMGTGSAMEVKGGMHASVGDYVKYDLDAENYLNKTISSEGMNVGGSDFSLKIQKESSEVKFTGTENIQANGKTFKCMIANQNMEIQAIATGKYNGMDFSMDLHMILENKQWLDTTSGASVRVVHTEYTYMNITLKSQILGDQNMSSADKTVMETTYNPPMNEIKGTSVKAGDEWTVTTNATIKTMKYTMENGKWSEKGSASTEVTVQTDHYRAIKEATVHTPAGTFNTLEIKTWEGNESGNYTVIYSTENGMPVKVDIYSNGEVVMSEEATDYKYADAGASDESEESSTPGFEGVFAISAIGIALGAYSLKRK